VPAIVRIEEFPNSPPAPLYLELRACGLAAIAGHGAHVSGIASTPGDRHKPERSIAKSHRAGSALVIKSR